MYITFEQRNHYDSILRSLYLLLHNYKRGRKKQVKRRISGNVEWPRLAEIANVIGLSEWYLLSIYCVRLSTSISYQSYFDAKLVMPR